EMRILTTTLLGTILLPLAFGQTDVARIVGTVADATGAVIPKAAITVTNESTGQVRKVLGNETGAFVVTPLSPASYGVKAEAQGMAVAEFTGVRLQVGQERVLNITLQPSSVSTAVNVSGGDMTVIDVSSARIGANISQREVAELPMNG